MAEDGYKAILIDQSMRNQIAMTWLIQAVFLPIVSCFTSLLYWHFSYISSGTHSWRPLDDWQMICTMLPIGFVLQVLLPSGWLMLIGLLASLNWNKMRLLWISALGSLLFGWIWPRFIIAAMGV